MQRKGRAYLLLLLLVVGRVETRSLLAVVWDRPLAFAKRLGGGGVGVGGRHLDDRLNAMNSPDSEVYTGRVQGKGRW